MTDLAYLSLTEAATLVEKREISPVELTRQQLARIEDVDARLHSYRTVLADRALEQAREAEQEIVAGRYRGPLHGIPIAVKDLCYTKGIPTACGSMLLQDWCPTVDATVVARLEAAGAILLGKLHMTEFALRWHHPAIPMPVNPWGPTLWPGVSSSGSGVATAAGLCYGSLGTDTGGSIRFPSASNGVVGLKPTYGRVSRYGVFPLAASFDNVGPITRSVADAAAMLEVLAGHDPDDPTSSYQPVPPYLSAIDGDIKGLRVGVDERFISQGATPEVTAAVLRAVAHLRDLGLEVVEITVPTMEALSETWTAICAADAGDAHREMYPRAPTSMDRSANGLNSPTSNAASTMPRPTPNAWPMRAKSPVCSRTSICWRARRCRRRRNQSTTRGCRSWPQATRGPTSPIRLTSATAPR